MIQSTVGWGRDVFYRPPSLTFISNGLCLMIWKGMMERLARVQLPHNVANRVARQRQNASIRVAAVAPRGSSMVPTSV